MFDWNGELIKRQDTFYVFVHHAQATKCTVQDVHTWHVMENGWIGIGYHYFIDKNGNVWNGRPLDMVGAHTKGYNHNSIGICLEGDYTVEKISEHVKSVLVNLLVSIKRTYDKIKILRHMDVNQTSCPGEIDWVNILARVDTKFNTKDVTLEERVKVLEKNNKKIFEILRKNNLDLR